MTLSVALRPASALLLALLACASEPPRAAQPAFYHPPPKPGSSITASKLCECRSCDPDACCGRDDAPATAGPLCQDDYEFADECGLQIASCTSRCTRHVWRIVNSASCDDKPPICCH